uniref:Uncharacterized protein n=1 Tax=Aegilops tauschii subsp. strangulata TaxID=200361 RepID=A0A453KMW2_AEGTS
GGLGFSDRGSTTCFYVFARGVDRSKQQRHLSVRLIVSSLSGTSSPAAQNQHQRRRPARHTAKAQPTRPFPHPYPA